MKQAILLLITLLTACGGREAADTARTESGEQVQVANLTGLYEVVGDGAQRGRMCMVSDASGVASFGIVTETPDGGCGGAGEAMREANLLRLTMGGDEECVIEAQIAGTQVTLPATLPDGCSYYCASGATLAGATLEKTGGTAEDAMQAMDLAGGPLCG